MHQFQTRRLVAAALAMSTVGEAAELLHVQEQLDASLLEAETSPSAAARKAAAKRSAALLDERRVAVAALRDGGRSFWAAALAAHPGVGAAIDLRDAPRLLALRHVYVVPRGVGGEGFGVAFEFAADAGITAPVTVVKLFGAHEVRGEARGRVEDGVRIGWQDGCRGGRFFDWLEGDEDWLGLGKVLRDYVIPRAVDLFFGTARLEEDDDDDEDYRDSDVAAS